MPQSYVSLNVHLIFSTKNRLPQINADLQPRLFDYIGGICRAEQSVLLAAGGMPDHVHLLVSLGKMAALADFLRVVKTNTSKWVHEEFPSQRDFAWQAGYGAFSVSPSGLDAVKAYIAKQAEHHRVRTFQEELVEFLNRHEIEYDERYLWD